MMHPAPRRPCRALIGLTAVLALTAALLSTSSAHEIRPALLEIQQVSAKEYTVLWKQPTMGETAIHLVPHISNGWLESSPAEVFSPDGFIVRRWKVSSSEADPLGGRLVSVEGLNNTITDVLVRVSLSDHRQLDAILAPTRPSVALRFGPHGAQPTLMYLQLGVVHILTGFDHLMFLLGLLLIVSDRWTLLRTVSAFTVAHSITLAFATVGELRPPIALLNTLIALSIVFLGPEILRRQRGETSLTLRHPELIAFGFGLLHGFGFAGGLASLGLPRAEIPWALLNFNVGVEIGQIAFLGVVLALKRAVGLTEISWPRPLAALPTYLVGSLGAYWAISSGIEMFGGSS